MSWFPSVWETLRKLWLSSHADIRGNDRDPSGPRPAAPGWAGARSRGQSRRAIERGPSGGREPPILRIVLCRRRRVTDGGQCRAQGSLRGRIARLRMGFVEKMPHLSPARCV